MSGKPSHIPLFPDSYHRDTTHLTTEEHGAYLLLLMAAWGSDDCTLPNDERRLAALSKLPLARWRKLAPTILEFWTREGSRLSQKRLRQEWDYVNEKRGKRKEAANARWASKSNASAYANGMHLGGGEGGGALPGGELSRATSPEGDDGDVVFRVVEGGR